MAEEFQKAHLTPSRSQESTRGLPSAIPPMRQPKVTLRPCVRFTLWCNRCRIQERGTVSHHPTSHHYRFTAGRNGGPKRCASWCTWIGSSEPPLPSDPRPATTL